MRFSFFFFFFRGRRGARKRKKRKGVDVVASGGKKENKTRLTVHVPLEQRREVLADSAHGGAHVGVEARALGLGCRRRSSSDFIVVVILGWRRSWRWRRRRRRCRIRLHLGLPRRGGLDRRGKRRGLAVQAPCQALEDRKRRLRGGGGGGSCSGGSSGAPRPPLSQARLATWPRRR